MVIDWHAYESGPGWWARVDGIRGRVQISKVGARWAATVENFSGSHKDPEVVRAAAESKIRELRKERGFNDA